MSDEKTSPNPDDVKQQIRAAIERIRQQFNLDAELACSENDKQRAEKAGTDSSD